MLINMNVEGKMGSRIVRKIASLVPVLRCVGVFREGGLSRRVVWIGMVTFCSMFWLALILLVLFY